jgi:L-iditol 2-dehydrogenase
VLLRVEAVGICGSDVHYYKQGRIGSDVVKFPFIIGHECSAIVEQTGKKVRRVKAGDRVAVDPAISCGGCDQCRAGRKNTCRNLKFLGCPGQIEGCLCEYIVMPEDCCYPYKNMRAWQAVLCEPMAIAVYAAKRAGLKKNDSCAVLGAGPIGLSVLLYSRIKTKEIYVTEIKKSRIEAAAKHGAVWVGKADEENIVEEILKKRPEGVDIVFECAGEQETIEQAIEILKPGGKLVIVGIPREEIISIPIHSMRRKDITIENIRRQNQCTFEAVDLIGRQIIDADFMITHRFKPEQAPEAFEIVSDYRDGVIKAVIEF